MGDSDCCPICLDTFTFPKVLPCGHTFCLQCLKHYSHEIDSRRELRCPLCRTKCKFSHTGLSQLATNYYVPISKPLEKCSNCRKSDISGCCRVCSSYFCIICLKIHVHRQASYESSNDDDAQQDPGMPVQFMLLQGIKTKYICKLETNFVVETPLDVAGRHLIYHLCASKSGDVFVVPYGVPYILKFDKKGKVLERIRTVKQCVSILELKDDNFLGTFIYDKLLLKYAHGLWSNFVSCYDFFPTDTVEISSGNIAVCGSNQLHCSNETTGFLQIYSPQGKPLRRLDRSFGNEKLLFFPLKMAYCKMKKTIAIADPVNSLVTVLQENGEFHQTYKGGSGMLTLRLAIFGFRTWVHFLPFGICYSPSGCFVISTVDGCLHVLESSGELRGVALTDCEDNFGQLTNITMDKNGIIWCSNSQNGTVKTFKIVKFTNDLDQNHNVN